MKLKIFILFIIFAIAYTYADELNIPKEVTVQEIISGVRIWGWSNTGKVAYSTENISPSGSVEINFCIFNMATDEEIQNIKIYASSEEVGKYFEICDKLNPTLYPREHWPRIAELMYKTKETEIKKILNNHLIIEGDSIFLKFPLIKNNIMYSCLIDNIEYDNLRWIDGSISDNKVIKKYSVTVLGKGKNKVIRSKIFPNNDSTIGAPDSYEIEIEVVGYVLSPFENRILICIRHTDSFIDPDYYYTFSGCHLGIGFE